MKRPEWITALLLAAVFAPAALALARVWSSVEHYSHGFLVPLAAGLVAHGIAQRNAALPARPDRRGALALAAALVLQVAGVLVGSASGQGLALVAALAAAIWWLRGAAWLRALAFPVAFLLFMVPIPPAWLAPVVVQLLLFVSTAAAGVLHALGLAVVREGNVIVLPDGQSLFVAEACSGLTSIVTLLPIAVLIAYLAPIGRGSKIALALLAVPIAMVANLIRVVATSMGASWWGVEFVTGDTVHALVGLAVYAIACAALLAVSRVLPRAPARRTRAAKPA
ncbi:MAG: hypothetical protein DCC71_09270 [Proteobacteria bacterium]|nr:MAG: hypothetical protein DCC71_09270 [Pseudomonadota bacterium]